MLLSTAPVNMDRMICCWLDIEYKKQKKVEIIPHEVIIRAGFSPVLKYSSDL